MRRVSPTLMSLIAIVAVGVAAFLVGREQAGDAKTTAKAGPLVGAVSPDGDKVKLRTEKPPKGQRKIRLKVIAAKGRNTLAFVPVFINGKGPLAFAVDTGASTTVIDEAVARKVGLKPGKSTGTMQGVAGSAEGREVKVGKWRADRIALKPDSISSLKGLAGKDGGGLEGLLGSDVLSRYGKVAIDYDADVLTLDPKIK